MVTGIPVPHLGLTKGRHVPQSPVPLLTPGITCIPTMTIGLAAFWFVEKQANAAGRPGYSVGRRWAGNMLLGPVRHPSIPFNPKGHTTWRRRSGCQIILFL